jgi:hypothetical protein
VQIYFITLALAQTGKILENFKNYLPNTQLINKQPVAGLERSWQKGARLQVSGFKFQGSQFCIPCTPAKRDRRCNL